MDERRIAELRETADHTTRRYELYRARVHGPEPTTSARLAELKRDAERAKLAMHRADAGA